MCLHIENVSLQLTVNGMNGAPGQHVVNHVALAPEAAPEPKLMEDQNALVIQMKTNHATQMHVQVCVNVLFRYNYNYMHISSNHLTELGQNSL